MDQSAAPSSVTSLDIQSCLAKYMQSANDLSNTYAKLNADQRLGVTHSLVGILFICLGIAFMFHSMLLSVGNGFIAYGIIEIVGAQGFIDFLKPVNSDGSNYSVFALGFSILLIMQGWGLVGFLLELYSIYMIFRGRCNTSELQMLISIAVNFLRQRVQYLPLLSSLLFPRQALGASPLVVAHDVRREPDQVDEVEKIKELEREHRISKTSPSKTEDSHHKEEQSSAEQNHVVKESLIIGDSAKTSETKLNIAAPSPAASLEDTATVKEGHMEDCDGEQKADDCSVREVESQSVEVGHKIVCVNDSDQGVDSGEKQAIQEEGINGGEKWNGHAVDGHEAISHQEACGHCLSEKCNVDPHAAAGSNQTDSKLVGHHEATPDKHEKDSHSIESNATECNDQTPEKKPPSIDDQAKADAVVVGAEPGQMEPDKSNETKQSTEKEHLETWERESEGTIQAETIEIEC